MKTTALTVLIAFLFPPAAFAQDAGPSAPLTASEIVDRMDKAMNFPEGTMTLSFEDVKANGSGRKLEARVLYVLDEGTLIEFVSPQREKGKRVLMIGDSMWMATPSVSRPVRMSGKDSFMGTSFTNDDMMNFTKDDDYDSRILSTSADGWKLELFARKKSLPYPRLIVDVDRAFLPLNMAMYALSGQESKHMAFSEVRDFEGKLRPATMTVTDVMAAGNKTIVRFTSIKSGKVDRARLSPAGFMK